MGGAKVVALGMDVGAIFANKEGQAYASQLQAIGMNNQDPLWQLPLWAPYRFHLDSPIADLQNKNQKTTQAGAVIAALYLNEFVRAPEGNEAAAAPPWLHIDFEAWIETAKPGRPVGGEAQAIRSVFQLIKQSIAKVP